MTKEFYRMKEVVVLIHGFTAHSVTMHFIKRDLERAGYSVLPLSYLTLFSKTKINDIGKKFSRLLNSKYDANTQIHFVGHSLGGVIIRSIISFSKIYQVGNVVTIGSPHNGALAADWTLKYLHFLTYIMGDIIRELVSGSETINRLPFPVHHGVIVGTLNRKPLNPFAYMTSDISDGLVELDSSTADTGCDVFISNTDHVTQLWDREVRRQIINYVRYGAFTHD